MIRSKFSPRFLFFLLPQLPTLQPGQSFSFVAKNVKGQKLLADKDVEGAKPLGLNY